MQRALFLALSILVSALLPRAEAALTGPTIGADLLEKLDISWGWDPEEPDFSDPSLSNWNVSLSITRDFPSTGGTLWNARVSVFHKTDPHPLLGENGGGSFAVLTGSFLSLSDFGLLINQTTSVPHRPVHEDTYTFTFDRSMAPQNNFIRLVGNHPPCAPSPGEQAPFGASQALNEACPVPEPSAASLLMVGLAALIGWSALAGRNIRPV
jgi:hypothetical protein